MNLKTPLVIFAALPCLSLWSCTPVAAAGDPITEWSATASSAATASAMAPLRTPITLAILHLAMYDAVNAIDGDRKPYQVTANVTQPASAEAAAVEAGYRILLAEFPGQQSMLESKYNELRANVPDSAAKSNGAAVGTAVARQLLALRANDGRNVAIPYVPAPGPGV